MMLYIIGNAHSWNQAGGYPPVPPPQNPHSGYPPPAYPGYPHSNPFHGGGVFPPPGLPQNNYELCKPGGGMYSSGLFRRVGYGTRLRSFYVRRVVRTERLEDCEKACLEEREFVCLSFNYRYVCFCSNICWI